MPGAVSRHDQIIEMVREIFPDRAYTLEGWHYPSKQRDYANPVKIYDLSLQELGGESSDEAILVRDESGNMYLSEKGLTKQKELPRSQWVINARKMHGIEPF